MKLCQFFVDLSTFMTSLAALARDKVSVFVEYRHGPVHVHFFYLAPARPVKAL